MDFVGACGWRAYALINDNQYLRSNSIAPNAVGVKTKKNAGYFRNPLY